MCERGTSTVIATPDWLWEERNAPENGIPIDSCIADTVLALWEFDVRTLGSCCGHGKQRPSLVLTQDSEMPEITRAALREVDPDRDWELLQWQLVTVSKVAP